MEYYQDEGVNLIWENFQVNLDQRKQVICFFFGNKINIVCERSSIASFINKQSRAHFVTL
jgi:hypothetical protein